MASQLLPEDVLVSILRLSEAKEFPASGPKIQLAVYRLAKQPEFSNYLGIFRFSGSPASPFSKDLDMALFNLQFAKQLKRPNLDFAEYEITEEIHSYFDNKVQPKLKEGDKPRLEMLSHQFMSIVNA